MKTEESNLYTSAEAYLNGPDGMNNEVTMWAVSAGVLLKELVKKGVNTMYGGLHQNIGLEIKKLLPECSILDMCSGPGNFPNYLSLVSDKIRVIGVDINPLFVKSANERFGQYGWQFIKADACSVNLMRQFNFVTASSAYHHITDELKEVFLRNINRHLLSSGKVIMCENFLPRYSSRRERINVVNTYYASLDDYFKEGNATIESQKAIREVRELELSGVEEHKVDFHRFKYHLKKSGLEIELDIPIWQPFSFKNSNAGSHVLLLRKST
ncbi:class I SAM-dependent methyltransferase [Candidatus Pacearchaeota archaeon]|nr:class I SAM-dependent methyltransferase [Candidatus Pacearchaeota archaeon]